MNSLNEMLEDMRVNKPSNYYKGTIYNVIKQNSIQNRLAQYIGDYDNIILYYNPSGPTVEVHMFNSPNNINVDNNYRLNIYMSGQSFYGGYRANNVVVSENPNKTNQSIYARAYIDGNNNNQLYFAFTGITIGNISNIGQVRNQFLGWTNYVEIPPFKVTSTFEDISVDSVTNKAFRLDYNQSFTNIGHIEDISDDSHFVNITFSQVGGGLILRDTLNLYNMFNSNEDFYVDENFDIYIRNRLLMYNTKYLLTADTFTDSTFTTQTGNYELNYYTLTLNAVINSGVITNYGSGEFTTQNSTNDIIGSLTDYNPLNSGDIINNIDVVPMFQDSSIYNFFYDMLQHISDIFLLDTEVSLDVTLPIFANEIHIPSNFWVTSNYLPGLADFLNGCWWVFICMVIVYKVDFMVELFNFGDFIGAMGEIYQTRRLL